MIIRILALDPQPEKGRSDVLCYQVPENSREHKLLVHLLGMYGIEHTALGPTLRKTKAKKREGASDAG